MKAKLKVIKANITECKVDAIVNATNSTLLGGLGEDGAILRAAGPELLEECIKLKGCAIGHAKLTPGFQLPVKYIIHTVGPIWRGGTKGEPQLLAACYINTLKLALEKQIKTIAFPTISCGIYGYPLTQATTIAVKETANFLELHSNMDTVYFVCFDDPAFDAYNQALNSL